MHESSEKAASTPAAQRLKDRIRSSGALPFATFMEEALYGDGGYYRRERAPIGEEGDYVTGSALSPLFGRSTARLLRRLDRALGREAEMLEVGYGNGDHLAAVAESFAGEGRRLRGCDRHGRELPPAAASVELLPSLDLVAPADVEGLIFSYELFDALAVHRLIGTEKGGVEELWVELGPDGSFAWSQRPLSDPSLVELLGGTQLAPGQVADLAPGWEPLYRRLARRLGRGLLVTCDYGFERERLFDARVRAAGTLACYREQRVHRNPFVEVGRQDLTAHVDLTRLREAGEDEGLATVALTRQALWLTACGLFEEIEPGRTAPALRAEAMALLDGGGMGEEIRVLVQAKRVEAGEILDLTLLSAAS